MKSENFQKIKIDLVLLLINLFKKTGLFILFLLEKTAEGISALILFIFKIILFLFTPLYLEIKKIVKKLFSYFPYQKSLFYFLSQEKIIILFFILIFIFIISEQTVSAEEDTLEQLFISPQSEISITTDFKIASSEEDLLEGAQQKTNLILDREFIPTRTEIEKYVVEPGDTISSIAEDFGVSVNTLLWENKLTSRSIIKPGQVLSILPVSGVSHKIKSGETVEKIAKLYRANAEEIIKFNDLEERPIKVGEIIIVPEGKISPPPPAPRIPIQKDKTWLAELGETTREGTNCRNFYPGQCTYFVAQKYCIPWSGHAKSWLANAQKYGYAIGKEPKVGAIISLRETWYGHIGIVEEVNDKTIIISEMNHLGPWKINKREINKNDWRINGYIYMR